MSASRAAASPFGASRPATARWPGGRRDGARGAGDRGQSTVELALLLPVVLVLLVAVANVGRLGHDAIALAHAAREAARAAAVDPGPDVARAAAVRGGGLDGDRLRVRVTGRGAPGSIVTVELAYPVAVIVPFAGGRSPDVVLTARAASRVEA